MQETYEYPDRAGTFRYAAGPDTQEYAVDIARVACALLRARIAIRASSFESWRDQYALRFRGELRKYRDAAIRADRHASLTQQLYDASFSDPWSAIKTAESTITSFLTSQPA